MTVPWAQIENCTEGLELGVSAWIRISQEQIDHFAQATGDFQFIHVDPERAAREGPFGGAVVHGYLLLSMMPILLAERIAFPREAVVVNFGLEKLRFAAPVRAGERIRGRFAITGRNRMDPTRTILKVRGSIEAQNAARPAVTADPLIALVVFPPALPAVPTDPESNRPIPSPWQS